MPITLEDGFLQTHDLTHVSALGIQSHRLEDCVALACLCSECRNRLGYPS